MEVFNEKNTRNTGDLAVLTSHMLVSPRNSSAKNLSVQISTVPEGSAQPVHAHPPEQVYYVIEGRGLMMIDGEEREVGPGDALVIPGNRKHGMKNIGAGELRYLTVNSPPFSADYEDRLWPAGPDGKG